jgi:hypothetical protein
LSAISEVIAEEGALAGSSMITAERGERRRHGTIRREPK